jgi:hypothetical protein
MMRNSLIIVLLCCVFQNISAQEATETPIPRERPIESIFANDTCAPPCWFELLVGESTGQEALDFLLSDEHVFEPFIYEDSKFNLIELGTEAREDARYSFSFGPSERPLNYGIYSYVLIREGLLDEISIIVRENVTLGEVIENMGWPDEIRMFRNTWSEHTTFVFDFLYYEPYFRLWLATEQHTRREVLCNFVSTQDNFFASDADYYSPRSAMELVEIYVPDGEPKQYQPRFLAYIAEEYYVPPELWSILQGDTAYLCQDLWERLSYDRILPDWYEETVEDQ